MLGFLCIANIAVSFANVIMEIFVSLDVSADKSAVHNKYGNGLRTHFLMGFLIGLHGCLL
jgi:hypothetical protein